MKRHRYIILLGLAIALAIGSSAMGRDKIVVPADLPETYREWLQQVDPLITREETVAFLDLHKDYHRDAFIDRFWRARDPFPDTARNELRERWAARLVQAQAWFRRLDDDRTRVLLLNGVPDFRCRDFRTSRELWYYDGSDRTPGRFNVLFHQFSVNGPYRIWVPGLTLDERGSGGAGRGAGVAARLCPVGTMDTLLQSLRGESGLSYYASTLSQIYGAPDPPSTEWVLTFAAYSTVLPDGAATFPAELEVEYPGRYQSRTVMQAILAVVPAVVARSDLGQSESYNFLLVGEVVRDDKLFDSFRYRFDIPRDLVGASELTGEERIPLIFQRYLRPGEYTLVLKLEDLNGTSFFHQEQLLSVPRVEHVDSAALASSPSLRMLAEANEALTTGDTAVKIVQPLGALLTGLVRFDVRVSGPGFDHLDFLVDGRRIMTKNRPPYNVELDMGALPTVRVLRVAAIDGAGNEVASDELMINASRNRFLVRLIEPHAGKTYRRSLQAHAKVEAPDGHEVQRVEFYLNEQHLATLFQPPYVQPIVLPGDTEVAYVRAVAYLIDGNSTEDLVFVNAPDYLDEVEVHMVELYTSVLDGAGRPVRDLRAEDFTVFEEGVVQELSRFEKVEDRPIHAGILLDTSFSMHERIDEAKAAALKFLRDTITPKDRAAIIPFHDEPYVAVKFTSDIAALGQGLIGIRAERGTALYDSLIYALYYFNGVRGQRTILVLSDGRDEHSSFEFEDAMEYARRSGVTIYTIGLDIGHGTGKARRQLTHLAEVTGGRSFFIKRVDQLDEIYKQIETEIRSQYLLAFQSSNLSESDEFRSVRVEVTGSDRRAKSIQGYYP